MQRLNTGYFYQLGWQVHQLANVTMQSKRSDWYLMFATAKGVLDQFTSEAIIPAPLSKQAARNLLQAIDTVFPSQWSEAQSADELVGYHAFGMVERLREFEHVLAAELSQIETFVTAQKGIFDTKRLVEDAEFMFPEPVRPWLSEQAKIDIRQAGRCLAFELPTATGFHLARAVEDSIRKYYEIVAGESYDTKKHGRSWAKYISALKSQGAENKVLNALDQMRELHRNPISHPDINLSTAEALMLVGLAQSAIVAMATDCEMRNSTE